MIVMMRYADQVGRGRETKLAADVAGGAGAASEVEQIEQRGPFAADHAEALRASSSSVRNSVAPSAA